MLFEVNKQDLTQKLNPQAFVSYEHPTISSNRNIHTNLTIKCINVNVTTGKLFIYKRLSRVGVNCWGVNDKKGTLTRNVK